MRWFTCRRVDSARKNANSGPSAHPVPFYNTPKHQDKFQLSTIPAPTQPFIPVSTTGCIRPVYGQGAYLPPSQFQYFVLSPKDRQRSCKARRSTRVVGCFIECRCQVLLLQLNKMRLTERQGLLFCVCLKQI